MPREIALHGVYVPTVTLLFLICLVLVWGLDRLLAWVGVYRFVWHPPLFRVCLFACLYGGAALYVYR
ncbi:efflux system membrane protein [compost metagenome]